VQAPERSNPTDGDRDGVWHAGENPAVEENSPAGDLADVDQLVGVLVLASTPTEPEVTDVTPASTARVLICDHHGIRARMLGQPGFGFDVEGNAEFHP
jgi:hypothetical protein